MTYQDLLNALSKMTPEQLQCDVTVESEYENECYPARLIFASDIHDSLDEDYPILMF